MEYIEHQRDGYRISTDPLRVDIDAVHAYLTRSYWATGVPREIVAKSIGGSLCFSLFDQDQQIGFARAVTDRATFAYLADVYVLEEYPPLARPEIFMEINHPNLYLKQLLAGP